VTRRFGLLWIPALFLNPLLGEVKVRVRGKLLRGRKLQLPSGDVVRLQGDEAILLVLDDERLWDSDFEVEGTPSSGGAFAIDPIHLKPAFVFEKGERLGVSYWCDICYIRTYSPGKCWCCQEETRLDPKDPNTPDRKP
jgi:hypothetical protein